MSAHKGEEGGGCWGGQEIDSKWRQSTTEVQTQNYRAVLAS